MDILESVEHTLEKGVEEVMSLSFDVGGGRVRVELRAPLGDLYPKQTVRRTECTAFRHGTCCA